MFHGEIHHLIPLYLGGGHRQQNLKKVSGSASTPGAAHQIMHSLIDKTSVAILVEDHLRETTLKWSDLAKAIPKKVREVLIGTLFEGGAIKYEEFDKKAVSELI